MKLLSAFHDTKSRKYGIYYSIVLASVSIILVLEGLNLVHLTNMQHMCTYFEGFSSLVMISRNDLGRAFLQNLNCVEFFQRK